MRLEINYREKNRKKQKHMEAKQYTTNNQEIAEEIKEEIKKYLETNDNELRSKTNGLQSKTYGMQQKQF